MSTLMMLVFAAKLEILTRQVVARAIRASVTTREPSGVVLVEKADDIVVWTASAMTCAFHHQRVAGMPPTIGSTTIANYTAEMELCRIVFI